MATIEQGGRPAKGAESLKSPRALALEWAIGSGKSEQQAAWDERKARLAVAVARGLGRMERRGFGPASEARFVGALGLSDLLAMARVEWLAPSVRREIRDYARGLGAEPGRKICPSAWERHEWMRFEIASALLARGGRRCDEAGIEAACESVAWGVIPKTLPELRARVEREGLMEWLPAPEAGSGGLRL